MLYASALRTLLSALASSASAKNRSLLLALSLISLLVEYNISSQNTGRLTLSLSQTYSVRPRDCSLALTLSSWEYTLRHSLTHISHRASVLCIELADVDSVGCDRYVLYRARMLALSASSCLDHIFLYFGMFGTLYQKSSILVSYVGSQNFYGPLLLIK